MADLGVRLTTPPAGRRVAVVGAGWAGLACAVRLVHAGARVTLVDAAHMPGGRARRVEMRGVSLDNGQHILIGAYARCLALMRDIGLDPDALLMRLPLALECPGRFRFATPRWPAPWHVLFGTLCARGLSIKDRIALLRWMVHLRLSNYAAPAHQTVTQWTAHLPQAVRTWLIDPLCLSTLNTPPRDASARVLANVLRDSLGAHRADCDLLLPSVDLGALFPEAAVRWLEAQGAHVRLGHAVRSIERSADGGDWSLDGSLDDRFDTVVLAVPPWVARHLLEKLDAPELTSLVDMLAGLRWEPITTVYLKPSEPLVLPRPMIALDPDPARHRHGQFAFDRSGCGGPAGWVSVVVSASERALELAPDELAQSCAAQLATLLNRPIHYEQMRVIHEKRATFACTPGLARPDGETGIKGLILAGDYTAGDYPATLEQAVRSGERAARLVD